MTTDLVAAVDTEPALAVQPAARPGRRGRRPWGVYLAAGWVALMLTSAVLAGVLPIADPDANVTPTTQPPFHHWPEFLGTDQLGRSVVSRLVFGARVSLAIGVATAVVATLIGVTLGMLAASSRIADEVIGAVTDSALAVPGIVILIALRAGFGPEFGTPLLPPGVGPLLIGLTFVAVPPIVRLSRATSKQVVGRDYVAAARLLGARTHRVLVREVLPSVMRPVTAYAIVVLAVLMVVEASVSFLGLGVQTPTPSWGSMISDGQRTLPEHLELVLVPATVLFLTVLSIGVLGRWLTAKVGTGMSRVS